MYITIDYHRYRGVTFHSQNSDIQITCISLMHTVADQSVWHRKLLREMLSSREEPRLLSIPIRVIWHMEGRGERVGDVGQHSSFSPTSAAGACPRSLSLEPVAQLMGLLHHHHLDIHSSTSIISNNLAADPWGRNIACLWLCLGIEYWLTIEDSL